jgi:hypothetical protein
MALQMDFDTLCNHVKYFPHDFIRHEPVRQNLHDTYVRTLFRPLPDEDDLRVYHHGVQVIGERLPWDSSFFGFNIAKLHGAWGSAKRDDLDLALWKFHMECEDRDISYIFAALPVEEIAVTQALGRMGWEMLEPRVVYHRPLDTYDFPASFPVREATEDDIATLSRWASTIVNPFDRFHTDEFLPPARVEHLMKRWVEASVRHEFADLVLVPDIGKDPARSYMSVQYHADQWGNWLFRMSRPGNATIHPDDHGWYTRLLNEVCVRLRDKGIEHLYIPAASANRAVIAAWHKLGFRFGRAENVFRFVWPLQ